MEAKKNCWRTNTTGARLLLKVRSGGHSQVQQRRAFIYIWASDDRCNRIGPLTAVLLTAVLCHDQKVNTTVTEAGERHLYASTKSQQHDPHVHVNLGLLKSYEHMGIVRVECVRGCSCNATSFNTDDVKDHTSQTVFYHLEVSQSSSCVIALTCTGESTSKDKEHKIVLRALSISAHQALTKLG